jgi:hypothetical protein
VFHYSQWPWRPVKRHTPRQSRQRATPQVTRGCHLQALPRGTAIARTLQITPNFYRHLWYTAQFDTRNFIPRRRGLPVPAGANPGGGLGKNPVAVAPRATAQRASWRCPPLGPLPAHHSLHRPTAARTVATTFCRTVSGRSYHAATTAARSGSETTFAASARCACDALFGRPPCFSGISRVWSKL